MPARPAVTTSRAPRTPSSVTAHGLTAPDMTGSAGSEPRSEPSEHLYDDSDPRKEQESPKYMTCSPDDWIRFWVRWCLFGMLGARGRFRVSPHIV